MHQRNQYNTILHAAHKVVHDTDVNNLALVLKKTPNTLRNEVNYNLTGPKLGLVDAAKITVETQNPELLQAFNLSCGYIAIPLHDIKALEDQELLEGWGLWQAKVGQTSETICRALEDKVITPNEYQEISHIFLEKTAAFIQLLQMLKGYDSSKKEMERVS